MSWFTVRLCTWHSIRAGWLPHAPSFFFVISAYWSPHQTPHFGSSWCSYEQVTPFCVLKRIHMVTFFFHVTSSNKCFINDNKSSH